jgi:hypothetical protein
MQSRPCPFGHKPRPPCGTRWHGTFDCCRFREREAQSFRRSNGGDTEGITSCRHRIHRRERRRSGRETAKKGVKNELRSPRPPMATKSNKAEPHSEVSGEVLRRDLTPLRLPPPDYRGLVITHNDGGVPAADKIPTREAWGRPAFRNFFPPSFFWPPQRLP